METGESTKVVTAPHVPNYDLVRRIGGGAYGEVWLGRNVLGTYHGVKIVRRDAFTEERPFDREFEGVQHFEPISRLHPGFVSILHVGRNVPGGYFYYVMELADDAGRQATFEPADYTARTLSEDIRQRGRLPVTECIQLGISLSEALGYLHRQSLVHRDIKPSNIVYINGTPRLADIGMVTGAREPRSAVGTRNFMPKEDPGTMSADIFALGKVLYQAATGNPVEKFADLPTSQGDSPDLPRFTRLNGIILKACAQNSADRYQTVDELRRALVELQVGPPSFAPEHQANPPAVAAPPASSPSARRLLILCQSTQEPDGRLLELLRRRLTGSGLEVVDDRRVTAGLDWARQLDEKIQAANAVVILLSANSIESEMLAYEIDMAHHAAQRRNGQPRCFPVRVQFAGAWPASLQSFLAQKTALTWNGVEDDDRLIEELLNALQGSERAAPCQCPARPRIEAAGGAVDPDSPFYVVRPTDHAFEQAVRRWDSIVLVKGARQMGKTSLLARGLQLARKSGARVALSDFQKLSLQDFASAETFYLALAEFLADQLELGVMPEAKWEKRRGPNSNFERFMRREVLGKSTGQVLWVLDEVDRLFTCAFGGEVFALLRSWHNERALDPKGPWSRLTVAIAYATEAHLFIADVNQSPFNVGTRVDLEDFTLEQVADLNVRYGRPLQSRDELVRLHSLLGGQPYLVRRAFDELAQRNISFEALSVEADHDEGIFGDHLRRMLIMLAKDPALLEVVRGVLQGRPCPDPASFYRLRSGGVMRGESAADVRPRCEIYATYLKRELG